MQLAEPPIPLLVMVGPTAVGKTEISLRVAEKLGGEIVSADSRLFYRGMDIGTAKPTAAERAHVPHHLIDVADPDERWSLTIFQREAARAIVDIHQRGRLPLLVGGTGQYIWAVVDAWKPPEQAPDDRLRTVLEKWAETLGAVELHRRLAVVDAEAAKKIEVQNVRRSVRALEVIFSSGRLFSAQRVREKTPYDTLMVGLTRPRPELYARIDTRIEAMMAGGLKEEVRALLERGYRPDLNTLSAIGYREMIASIRGEISAEEAVIRMKRLTRRYVRQQSNWFRLEDKRIHWFEPGDGVVDEIVALTRKTFHLD